MDEEKLGYFSRKPFAMDVGTVATPYHGVVLRVRHDPLAPMASPEPPPPLALIVEDVLSQETPPIYGIQPKLLLVLLHKVDAALRSHVVLACKPCIEAGLT